MTHMCVCVCVSWQYDAENKFVLSAKFAWSYWGKHISKSDIKEYILNILTNAG